MKGTFLLNQKLARDGFDWGEIAWVCRPASAEAKQLAVLDVTITPTKGHEFHKHPDQEEVIYVISGSIEQWIEEKKQVLNPGDAVFIPANMVHASFALGDQDAHLLAIMGPSVGDGGYVMEDVSKEARWSGLR